MAERDDQDRLPALAASPADDPERRDGRRDNRRDPRRDPHGEDAREPGASIAPSSPAATARAKGGAFPIALVAVLGVMTISGAGFAYVQTQQLQLANAQLTNATDRIRRLEEELNITGSTLNETSSATKEKISAQESETKKLWDSSTRNRNAINETRRALGNTDKALVATTGRAAALEASSAQQAREIEQQRVMLARANDAIRTLAGSNRDLIDKVNSTDQTARALRASLERRVRETEEAVAAVDKFRQQMNRTVSNLAADVAALKAGGKPEG